MQPTCITCGRLVEEGETCCRTCLAEVTEQEFKFLNAVADYLELMGVKP